MKMFHWLRITTIFEGKNLGCSFRGWGIMGDCFVLTHIETIMQMDN
jgi:hypothetical protein